MMDNDDLRRRLAEAHKTNRELQQEVQTLEALLDDSEQSARSWLQYKVSAQRKALDILNRKVLSQRFRLKLLAELGRDVSKEEYEVAKEKLDNPQVRDRILEFEPVG